MFINLHIKIISMIIHLMEEVSSHESAPTLPLMLRIITSVVSVVIAAARRRDGSVSRRLLNLIDPKVPPNPSPVNGVITYDVTVDQTQNLWFRVFKTTTNAGEGRSLPVIIYYHGGGFVHCYANSGLSDSFCRYIAREVGAVVVSVDYRLAPEHKYPAPYEDGFDALKFLDAYGGKYLPEFADLSSCFLAGDSAGGNMAHHIAVSACKSDFQQLKVKGIISIQPFFGGEERTLSEKREIGVLPVTTTDWWWDSFLPKGSTRDHEASNVSGPNAIDISSVKDFPATIVFLGTFDGLLDWQKRYCEWLNRNGKEIHVVEYRSMLHGYYLFPQHFKEYGQLVLEIKNFVQNHINT